MGEPNRDNLVDTEVLSMEDGDTESGSNPIQAELKDLCFSVLPEAQDVLRRR